MLAVVSQRSYCLRRGENEWGCQWYFQWLDRAERILISDST